MKNFRNTITVLSMVLLIQGCAFFNIGEPQGVCEEMGCDYSDAGVCGDVFAVYQTRYKDISKSYENIKCNECKEKNND